MMHTNKLSDCLAIDCNIEAYSSLSSSSSTSSSTTSLSSSNKNTHDEDEKPPHSKIHTLNTVISEFTDAPKASFESVINSASSLLDLTSSSGKLTLKNKKLNSLINGGGGVTTRRNVSKAKSKILSQSKFASVECLSCDEGYVGSFTDNTLLDMRSGPAATSCEQTSAAPPPPPRLEESLQHDLNRLLSPQDQLELLRFLLEHSISLAPEQQTVHLTVNEDRYDRNKSCFNKETI